MKNYQCLCVYVYNFFFNSSEFQLDYNIVRKRINKHGSHFQFDNRLDDCNIKADTSKVDFPNGIRLYKADTTYILGFIIL